MVTKEQVEEIIRVAKEGSRMNIIASQDLMPCFFLQTGKELSVVGTPYSSDAEKDAIVKFIREKVKEWKSDVVAHVFEAWVATGGVMPQWDSLRPSERPDRIEVVGLYVEVRGGKTRFFTAEIVRDANKKVTDLDEWKEAPYTGIMGRMTNYFKEG